MIDLIKYKLDIDVLSPIHIGDGNVYFPSEYIIEKNNIRRINIIKLYESLSDSERKVFLEALEDEKFILNEPEFNSICDNLEFKDKFTHEFLKKRYTKNIFNKIWDKPPAYNKKIDSCIKDNGKGYIPGSSLKGSIKTALFYNFVKEEDIPKLVEYIRMKQYDEPINYYFSSNFIENSSQGSIMRFFNVLDSTKCMDSICIYEIMAYTYKKRKLEKSNYQKAYLECIPNNLKKHLTSEIRINFDEKYYSDLAFEDDMKKCLDINFIKSSLNKFSEDIIYYEREFWKKSKRDDIVEFYDNLPIDEKKPLIRLGNDAGFHNKTIFLKIFNYDKEHGTKYLKDIEKTIDSSRKIKFPKYGFPKTRRVTNVENEPLGWAQLDFKRIN